MLHVSQLNLKLQMVYLFLGPKRVVHTHFENKSDEFVVSARSKLCTLLTSFMVFGNAIEKWANTGFPESLG